MRICRKLILSAFVSVNALALACPEGIPYEPRSALAGAGFSQLEATPQLPEGWNVYAFGGVVVPIPDQLANRVVLIEEEGRIRHIHLIGEGPSLVWSAHIAAARQGQSTRGEVLLRRAISKNIPRDQPIQKSQCIETVEALAFLDLVSRESAAAYDFGYAIALHGKRGPEDIFDVYWRNSDDELIIATWELAPAEAGILGHLSTDAEMWRTANPFQALLDCVQLSTAEVCQDIEVAGIAIESGFGLLPEAPDT